jgi:threonine 3-dehydrogenase
LRANALGTFYVLEAARLFRVPQVIFASTLATYGLDLEPGAPVDDFSLQRPELFYGATKVFAELMGLFYRRKYGLDFRGVRYPALVGPGVKTPGVVQYMARMIEESIKGNPFTVPVAPATRTPAMYFKDAARAVIELARAPREGIRMVNYLVAGATPIATAEDLAAVVRARVPGAQITFAPDPSVQGLLDRILHPPDDRMARAEWGWRAQYSLGEIVDDFLREMQTHPQRYA